MKLPVKGNNTIYGICDMDIIVYSIKAGNKMFPTTFTNDYVIPLVLDEKVNGIIESNKLEYFWIAELDDDDIEWVYDFTEFLQDYTKGLLKVVDSVLTSFEDDDIIGERAF